MVPESAVPPWTPSTYHLTPVLVVPVTDAANCLVVLVVTLAVSGVKLTTTCAHDVCAAKSMLSTVTTPASMREGDETDEPSVDCISSLCQYNCQYSSTGS